MAMFDRIEMDVIHVPSKIVIINDQVFPVPALPNAPLTLATAPQRPPFIGRHGA